MTQSPAVLAELWRNGILESYHYRHAVICDDTGQIVQAWGDPDTVIFPRSSCKMIQALPLIESGAADAHGLNPPQLALACASHQGAAIHTKPVADWLSELDLAEADLRCGAQPSADKGEKFRLIRAHENPCQLHNNCSGKHAGFLTLNKHLGGGAEYIDINRPVQKPLNPPLRTLQTTQALAVESMDARLRTTPQASTLWRDPWLFLQARLTAMTADQKRLTV